MTHDEAFLQAIIESPDDDTPRLVYSDWLDEHGESDRAEFIRAQVQLARLPEDDPRRPALKLRERALLGRHEAAWAEPFRGRVESWKFRRGFVEQITTGAAKFLTQVEQLFRLAPIRHARLRRPTWCLHRLAECPFLGRLTGLDLGGNAHRPGGSSFLLPSGVRALAASPHLHRLTTLLLFAANLNVYDVQHLVSAPALKGLTGLDLGGNNLGAAGARVLASAPSLRGLTTLRLQRAQLGNLGVRLLASSPYLTRLTDLDLGWNDLGGPAAAALAEAPNLAGLVRLDLSVNRLSIAGAKALAAAPHLQRLQRLAVTRPLLAAEAWAVLEHRFGNILWDSRS
jgi:uncharacterized protein (TIGR02996 family)